MQPLLPKLKVGIGNKVENFTGAGTWDSRGAGELDAVSESLDIVRIDPKYFDIDCVPDMWARPLLFEMALYDKRHLLNKRILGEWRGLLAMLALREWRNLRQLSVMNIQLPDSPNDVTGFMKIVKSLAPQKSLSSDTFWNNLYVILFESEAIGITSPTTLVCTASNYYNCISNVSWFNGRFLADPTSELGGSEKKALASWLKQLAENLGAHGGLDQTKESRWDALLGLLNEFQSDLGGAPKEDATLSGSGFGMTTGIFKHLDKPVAGVSTEESYVRLKSSRKEAPPMSLLVVDKDIAEQWSIPPQEILVYGTTTITSFPFDDLGSNYGQFGSVILPQNLQWRKSQNFFTEKLFMIDQQDAFPGAMIAKGYDRLQHQGSPVTPIIPIRSEILDYLEVDDLSRRIIFEQSDDGFIVKLRLPLTGVVDNLAKEEKRLEDALMTVSEEDREKLQNELEKIRAKRKPWDFEIKKEFRLDQGDIISIPNVPILEIWPNFKVPGWNLYYTYFSALSNTFYAEPYVPSDKPNESSLQTFKTNRSDIVGGIDCQITKTSTLPEAMKCQYMVADSQRGTMQQYECGVLLITQPKPLLKPVGSWLLGIDFGTTGTNVFFNDKSRQPDSIVFKRRFLQVTASEESARTSIYDRFLPGNDHNIPFLSFYHDFETKTNPPLRPLLDGHVFFLNDYGKFDASATGIAVDLKWSPERAIRIRTQAFLEQICLQCLAEAANNGAGEVSWRFSFPTAFSKDTLQDFRRIWAEITGSAYRATGIKPTDDVPVETPESIVSAFFFAEKQSAPFKKGTVCIDIGGGTSDISIWQENALCWQTSLRFAGRDILLEILCRKPDFLNIFQVNTDKLKNSIKDPKRFYAQADALITDKGKDWLDNLHHYLGDNKVKGFVSLIAIGLSGLYYYIGLMLQSLSKSGKYKAQMPNVYVAGNGSRLFHWLSSGLYEKRSHINVLFKNILMGSTGFQEDPTMFDISISPSPKSEAAFGSVCDRKILQYGDKEIKEIESQIDQIRYQVLAGELFAVNKTNHGWNEMITAEQLSAGIELQSKMERLEHFIQTFDKYAKSPDAVVLPIEADPVLINKIHGQIGTELKGFKGVKKESISVEPIFITELRALLKEKTEEWALNNP